MSRVASRNPSLEAPPTLTSALWLGYLLVLLAIDQLFYPRPVFPLPFYVVNGLCALAVLGLASRLRGTTWPGNTFPLLAIGLLSAVPVTLAQVATADRPPVGPAAGPEGILIRIMPLLLLALLLVVWQYGWRGVVAYSFGIGSYALALTVLLTRPGEPSLQPPLTVLAIQTTTFLLVGYFTSVLVAQLRRQNQSLADANARLSDHAAALEELTISRERNRMARELHDTLAHTLSALSVQLESAKAYYDVDPVAAAEILDTSLAVTRSGLQETRQALKDLRASPLDDLGLALALRHLATEAAERANIELEFTVPSRFPTLPAAIEQCIYRVAQEATTNVVHHAGARTMSVAVDLDDGVVLRIADDGRGFDPQAPVAEGHYGLAGMRERAAMVGGDLEVTSRPGTGTNVQLTIEDFDR